MCLHVDTSLLNFLSNCATTYSPQHTSVMEPVHYGHNVAIAVKQIGSMIKPILGPFLW